MQKKAKYVAAIGAAVVTMATAAVAATSAGADARQAHYYIEIGGTCGPQVHYDAANNANGLGPDRAFEINYPATAPPGCGVPLQAPSYDVSVGIGLDEARKVIRDIHRNDPGARFTVTGYSQGAHVANLVLNEIADGAIAIPHNQVNGKLFADPMQPGTGIGARVPRGASAFGFTSPGPGRTDFAGIPVQRYCIPTDAVCDLSSLEAPGGYVIEHPRYPLAFMPGHLTTEVTEPLTWLPRV